MTEVTGTASRKADHIRINLEEDVRSGLTTGLERLRFTHQALPERSLADVEGDMIRMAVTRYHGQMSEVARRLGIGRSTLYRKVRDLGIPFREDA